MWRMVSSPHADRSLAGNSVPDGYRQQATSVEGFERLIQGFRQASAVVAGQETGDAPFSEYFRALRLEAKSVIVAAFAIADPVVKLTAHIIYSKSQHFTLYTK